MKLDWITDPHLDHLKSEKELIAFVNLLHKRDSDGLMVTGDIAESPTIYEYLGIMSGAYQRPIYFVLGNHDHYKGWIADTHAKVQAVCKAVPRGILNWLTKSQPLHLRDKTWIVGHDGWYDGREGKGMATSTSLTDFLYQHGVFDLADARGLGKLNLFNKLRQLGDLSAQVLKMKLEEVLHQGAARVLVLTHVPPFLEASYFRGQPSKPDFAPFYVNKAMGDMLLQIASSHPDTIIEVFCGHTHGKREVDVLHNLKIRSGSARYGFLPQFQTSLEV